MKKNSLLFLVLFQLSATAMQRQIVPYNQSFNQNNDLSDLNDTPGQLNRLTMLDNEVTWLKNEVAESKLREARMLSVLNWYADRQEAEKQRKEKKKNEKLARLKQQQEIREQEARKAWYVRLNNLIPAYLPVATSAAGYAAGSVVAKNMYNSVCPNIIKNAPLVNATLQAGVEACGGKAGSTIATLAQENTPKTLAEATVMYGNFLHDVQRAEWGHYCPSLFNPKTWLVYSAANVKRNIPHAQLALDGTYIFMVIASHLQKKLQSKQSHATSN